MVWLFPIRRCASGHPVAKNPLPPSARPIRFGFMSSRRPQIIKTGLGRGLDELMTGTKTAGHNDASPEAPPQTIKVNVQAGPGLGTLLRGNRASEQAAETVQPGEQSDAQVGQHHPSNSHFHVARASSPASSRGVPTRGASNGETPSELAAETAALRRQNENCWHHPVVFCSLLAADILLLGQAALLILRATRAPSLMELLFAFICVGLGAWLACLAVLLRSPDRR